jgi:hypothetical protein
MSAKQQLENRLGFTVPADFVRIVDAFVERAGDFDKGLYLLEDYLGLGTGIRSADEGRGYEATPIEFFPFLYTGGDGEMYGYVNAAPELNLPDLPMGVFVPAGSAGVVHIGNTTVSAIENVISYIHAGTGFAEVDLPFLKKVGLLPTDGKADNVRLLDGEEYVRPTPSLPSGWKLAMTSDGVGVIAEDARFRPEPLKHWPSDAALANFLEDSEKDRRAGFLGSSLYHLKEAWWWKYHALDRGELSDLTGRLIAAYKALGKTALASVMKEYFDWLGRQ